MRVYLLNTKKRHNSTTVLPLGDTVEEVFLKENTSVIRPVFLIEYNISILEYNYLYCEEFSRYYFIRNIATGLNNWWELDCEVDTLASHKVDILQNTCFIERASVGYNDKIVDNLVTNLADFETINEIVSLDFFNDSGSYFIIGASNATMSTIWNINETYINTLANELMSDTGFIDEMQKYYNQPMNAIYTMHWLPFAVGTFGGIDSNVSFANWESDIVVGKRISDTTIVKEFGISIPKPYNDFRKTSACSYMLYLPCCVPIKIENSFIENSDLLYIKYVVDCADGNVIARIYTLENGFIVKTSGNVKTDKPIASITSNAIPRAIGVASGFGLSAIGAMSMNPITLASGLVSTVSSALIPPQVSATGNYGGKGAYVADNKQAILTCTYSSTVEPSDIVETSGRPVMRDERLLNYSGFVKCDNASVKIEATLEEIETINNLLNGGIYIE